MKLCIDCKHHKAWGTGTTCNRPGLGKSLVSGNQYWTPCGTEREGGWLLARLNKTCGKEARFFETKNSNLNSTA